MVIHFKNSSHSAVVFEALQVILTCSQPMHKNWSHAATHGQKACLPLTLRRDSWARGDALAPQLLPRTLAEASPSSPKPVCGLRSPPAWVCPRHSRWGAAVSGSGRQSQGLVLGGRGSWRSRRGGGGGAAPPPPPRGRLASRTPEAFAPTLKLAARSSKHCHHTDDILLLQRKII